MSAPAVPPGLQLPPTRRTQSAFREQRSQKLKEHLLKRKTFFLYKQETQAFSSNGQSVMTSEGSVHAETKILKTKTNMVDKENVSRPTGSRNNITVEKNCVPLKPSNELASSTTANDTYDSEDSSHTLQLLPVKDDPQRQHLTLSQAYHLKNNNKKKQVVTEKPKQDTDVPKKPMLGSYRGQIVQSKVNSFRKPLQVKDESSAAAEKHAPAVSKATMPQPGNTNRVVGRNDSASDVTAAPRCVSTAPQDRQLTRPPIRSHHNAQGAVNPGPKRTSASVPVQKGPCGKEWLQLNAVSSGVKTSSTQDVKRNKTLSRSTTSEIVARPASSSNTKLTEKSKSTDQHRHTTTKVTFSAGPARSRETAEERKARLSEWRAGKGRARARPPASGVTQPEPGGQEGKPAGSFWTTMAEEDEQRLFTEKVNRTFAECINLINEGCSKEEILVTLNDLIKNIPDAKKLVKYWICLARIEPLTSPIENIIAIYESAILAGAQPIEEMRHVIVDILTMKSQEKIKSGENTEVCAAKEQIPEVKPEDTGINVESEKLDVENTHHRNVVFQDCEKEQNDRTKDPSNDVKTPNTEIRASCLIKYNVSTAPCLQSIKKKIQSDETNSTFKELKFLTPVRRSQRIQDKTSQLPDMLKDHYPCVSSLEQLTELGSKTDAFVCRPNAALCRMYSETETTEDK
ncbi:cytoskeleton-associated protein 2 isoform X2 [Manis javanica]|uniref:cytoskeleton-associated protein 2 isoform X2 n=1 Tax=Manis javanica TaxID=9974 RepID=UPI003C6D8C89